MLNRYPLERYTEILSKSREKLDKPSVNTIHTMMYIFPRQFGLHNVFTKNVDTRETVQPFQDYTLREDEINKKLSELSPAKVPRRLRGRGVELMEKLQLQHSRCAYKKLLDHYCPVWSPAHSFYQYSLFRYQSHINQEWHHCHVLLQLPSSPSKPNL